MAHRLIDGCIAPLLAQKLKNLRKLHTLPFPQALIPVTNTNGTHISWCRASSGSKSWKITEMSLKTGLLVQQLVQPNTKEYIKAPHYWSFVRGIHSIPLNWNEMLIFRPFFKLMRLNQADTVPSSKSSYLYNGNPYSRKDSLKIEMTPRVLTLSATLSTTVLIFLVMSSSAQRIILYREILASFALLSPRSRSTARTISVKRKASGRGLRARRTCSISLIVIHSWKEGTVPEIFNMHSLDKSNNTLENIPIEPCDTNRAGCWLLRAFQCVTHCDITDAVGAALWCDA